MKVTKVSPLCLGKGERAWDREPRTGSVVLCSCFSTHVLAASPGDCPARFTLTLLGRNDG